MTRNEQIFQQDKHHDGSIDQVHKKELLEKEGDDVAEHYSLLKKGAYGRALDLRQHVTFVHLSGRLANLVYSMDVTNTDFYPHQYKHLLELLESPANGFLLADEVGLGKTIEAGLVWTELGGRSEMRR